MKPFFRLTAGLVCPLPSFVKKKTTWTAIFCAAASFMRYLDQNHAWFLSKAANRTFKYIKHKHESTGAGHFLKKCVLAPKPPYLYSTVPYKDDQVVIHHGIFLFNSFSGLIFFWRSSSTSTGRPRPFVGLLPRSYQGRRISELRSLQKSRKRTAFSSAEAGLRPPRVQKSKSRVPGPRN